MSHGGTGRLRVRTLIDGGRPQPRARCRGRAAIGIERGIDFEKHVPPWSLDQTPCCVGKFVWPMGGIEGCQNQQRSVSFMRRDIATNGRLGAVPALLGTMLFAGFFLPRFALHFGADRDFELSLAAAVTLGCVAILVLIGGIRPDPTRVALYCLTMACMIVSAILAGGGWAGRISTPSFLLLTCMYMACVFVVPAGDGVVYDATLRVFRRFALFVAVVGICQFALQFVIPGPNLFTWDSYLPKDTLAQNFNTVIPVPGSEDRLNKSNGFFLLEPSHFSQVLALAIIVELAFFRPTWRLAVLSLALLLSYSGTGMTLCAVFVPLLLIHRGHGRLLLLGFAGALFLAVFADLIHLTATFERLDEFDSEHSSAFARFLSPLYLFHDFVFPQIQTTLFGFGPGSIEPFKEATDYMIFDPTWGKVLFEYGVVGTIPFAVFVCHCFFAGARSYWLSSAVFFTYLLLGGYLIDARLEAFILPLVIFQSMRPAASAVPAYRFQAIQPRRS
jgi:hypothetical protein